MGRIGLSLGVGSVGGLGTYHTVLRTRPSGLTSLVVLSAPLPEDTGRGGRVLASPLRGGQHAGGNEGDRRVLGWSDFWMVLVASLRHSGPQTSPVLRPPGSPIPTKGSQKEKMLKGPKRFPSLVRGCVSLFLFFSFLGTPMSHSVSGRTVAFPARKTPRTLTVVCWASGA